MYTRTLLRAMLVVMYLAGSAFGGAMGEQHGLMDISGENWERLRGKTIYFAHQSVGGNVVDGMEDVIKRHPSITLPIYDFTGEMGDRPGLYHARVGANSDYTSKIDEFRDTVLSTPEIDIAFLKFCYLDITEKTDIQTMLQAYADAIDAIKEARPELVLIHFTVPLTVTKTTWKTKLKSLLGKHLWEYADNIARSRYNMLLVEKYADKDPIFDIAMVESGDAQAAFTFQGKRYLSLNPEFSNDGGHLNDLGRAKVAERLLTFLADTAH